MAKTNYVQIVRYLLTVDDSGTSRIGLEFGNGSTHQISYQRNEIDIFNSMADLLRNYTAYWDSNGNSITTNWV